MQRNALFLAAMTAFLLSACTPSSPTLGPTQIEATTLAHANELLTPRAITPRPRREIPGAPTGTIASTTGPLTLTDAPTLIMPSLAPSLEPRTPASTPSAECNHPLNQTVAVPKARVTINNNTEGPMAFAIGLANKTIFGLCGYVSLALIPAGSGDTVLLPEVHPELGDPCYWANAWIKDPRRRETVSDGGFCISSTHGWIINVNYGKIRLRTK